MDSICLSSRQQVDTTISAFKPRNKKRTLKYDQICYDCGCGGELIECDDCPRVFHTECIPSIDATSGESWRCPWHFCTCCGDETETATQAGCYCVLCPASYCNGCATAVAPDAQLNMRQFAALSTPTPETFSILRRKGFTLQNSDSRLFICYDCIPNTDNAVVKMLKQPTLGIVPKKKILSMKMSTPLKYKKLLKPQSNISSYHNFGDNTVTDISSDTDTDTQSMSLQCSDLSKVHPSASTSISISTSSTATVSPDLPVPVPITKYSCKGVKDLNKYPALKSFLESSDIIQMKSEGWKFLHIISSTDKNQFTPLDRGFNKFLGVKCRRYFAGSDYSDGIIVGYLSERKNNGTILFHCIYDDGDEEDLFEVEMLNGCEDYKLNNKSKIDSNKCKQAYKQKLDIELLALREINSIGDFGLHIPDPGLKIPDPGLKIPSLLTVSAVLSEMYRMVPVECVGLQFVHKYSATATATNTAFATAAGTTSTTPPTSPLCTTSSSMLHPHTPLTPSSSVSAAVTGTKGTIINIDNLIRPYVPVPVRSPFATSLPVSGRTHQPLPLPLLLPSALPLSLPLSPPLPVVLRKFKNSK